MSRESVEGFLRIVAGDSPEAQEAVDRYMEAADRADALPGFEMPNGEIVNLSPYTDEDKNA